MIVSLYGHTRQEIKSSIWSYTFLLARSLMYMIKGKKEELGTILIDLFTYYLFFFFFFFFNLHHSVPIFFFLISVSHCHF